jgi:hypothetical protein
LSKKNKPAKYRITKNVIGIDTGFIQASMMLDIAAQKAIATGDTEAMVSVADSWVGLSVAMKEVLDAPEEVDDEDDEAGSRHDKGSPIGFGVTAKDIKEYHDRNK